MQTVTQKKDHHNAFSFLQFSSFIFASMGLRCYQQSPGTQGEGLIKVKLNTKCNPLRTHQVTPTRVFPRLRKTPAMIKEYSYFVNCSQLPPELYTYRSMKWHTAMRIESQMSHCKKMVIQIQQNPNSLIVNLSIFRNPFLVRRCLGQCQL